MHREAVFGSALIAVGGLIVFLLLSSVLHGPRPPQPPRSQAAAPGPAIRLVEPATKLSSPVPGEPRPGAADRDAERRSELQKISEALKTYHDKNGRYPSSGGNAQTACAYVSADVLCQFRSQLGDQTFRDPAGDPQTYGYWYISDGTSYVLLASMEEAVSPEESCVPRNFVKPNLYCVQPQ